ncbi:MAG: DUF3570 domain-containing protein [Sandaracinaceae bacterium]|nr:DUF3570 domain-containing protein [Sandaracinaceae bacterium]
MRLQLIQHRLAPWIVVGIALAAVGVRAEGGEVDVGATLFHEGGGPLNMTVITPSVRGRVDPVDELTIRLGWDADIVTGASVAVVDAPGARPDAITTATQLEDLRNVFSGGMELRSDYGSLRAGYSYGFEHDYTSHALTLGARAELFERNTTFDLSFAHAWDSVCDVAQPRMQDPVERRRLPSSTGCFSSSNTDLASREVALNSFQGSWTQAWAPIFVTQLTLSAQLVDGFQSNPYRAVWLGRSSAQEHHPDHRFRYAASLAGRLWIAPISGALHAMGRAYRDNWGVQSLSAELALEEVIDGALRIRARGRYYAQSGAAFYSDDYALSPRGQYFTGDRELSTMSSVLVGGQISYTFSAGVDGPVAGFMSSLALLLKADWLHSEFPQFHYGSAAVPNRDAVIVTLSLEAEI